ncbi:RNA polymerase, sigma subunit, RpsG/SigG [Streptomyces sp. 2224.1]|uniref:SigB/SigF/SigG family RNA polymerase sigma factor n=1 Tax=unclassified Streptomyces TaxID=2593676 RepID=UPI0008849133|nr:MULTISPECIES: SigB/SigF/SigG family RNA polymerase sigma factor [unclassified Streptomyces]PBC86951.1 RNA polymerase sigma (RpsG/SigG) subunit [Streptomyces sp. 2321.6]SDQ66733.1 RNA polymerase, sigma subunit, RpsG/SigG [Streptomyces sp. KS_16]SED35012.1 RNA polymerase, sigma subunit, RpsG/SigG [Streptomyces sp. 2112.3]SED76970.1 RNA polymerase, sigma subunit, RpsG/SigG [Streptomyces sp. 2224.1]SEE14647.1 RNA polymerase, sigma subunit, RpsG/SigG [Streptomyces sp. 2133.1]
MSSNSTMNVGTELETTPQECAAPAPSVLPRIQAPLRVAPSDARELSKQFLLRLQELEEGTPEYQYARNTLIEMNLSLVRYVARRFSSRQESMEDVLQVGTIGLIKAIDRYDPSRDVEFTTLAVPYIQGEIKRFFRDTTWSVRVPRRLQELRIDLARAREELESEGSHEPSVAELAARLDLAEDEVAEGLVASNGYDSDSIDRPVQAGGGKQQTTGLVADLMGAEDPALALAEDIQALKPHLAELDDRERTLLQLRFGEEMTQSEIGAELGLSQMHVSRLLTRVCTTLRKGLLAGR